VVVQSSPFNQSRIATVIVAVVTSKLALASAPGNVRVGKSESGLAKPSVVIVSRIRTLERALLTQRVRGLPADTMRQIEEGLRLAMDV
jgi:mRNA interferase MazF